MNTIRNDAGGTAPAARLCRVVSCIMTLAFFITSCTRIAAQTRVIDSLQKVISETRIEDTNTVHTLLKLSQEWDKRDKLQGHLLDRRAAALSLKLKYMRGYARSLNAIGGYFIREARYDSALAYFEQALEIGRNNRDVFVLAKTYMRMGQAYNGMGDRNRALTCAVTALSHGEKLADSTIIAEVENFIGILYFEQDKRDLAITHWDRALRIHEKRGNRGGVATLLLNIANATGDNNRAVEYYTRSLRYYEESGDKNGIAYVALNMGKTLRELHRVQEALDIYTRGWIAAQELDDGYLKTGIACNFAALYNALGEKERALNLYQRGLDLAEKRRDTYWEAHALFGLASLSSCLDADLVFEYNRRALQAARRIGARDVIRKALDNLRMHTASRQDYANAYAYTEQLMILKDSLSAEHIAKTIEEVSARYDTEKRVAQIRDLEREKKIREYEMARQRDELQKQALLAAQRNQKLELLARLRDLDHLRAAATEQALERERIAHEKRKNDIALLTKDKQLTEAVLSRERLLRNSIAGGLLLTLVASILGYKRVQDKKRETALRAEAAEYKAQAVELRVLALLADSERREKEAQKRFSGKLIASQEQERKRIAAELHDGIGHDMLMIGSQADIALLETDPDRARECLEHISLMARESLGDVRRLSRNLRPVQLERAGITETLNDMLFQVAGTSHIVFTHAITNIDGVFSKDAEMNLFRIVQEAVSNILRHSNASEASVTIDADPKVVTLTVRDNGIGIRKHAADEDPLHAGFGIQGMRERAQLLGGEVELLSTAGDGTTVLVVIPRPAGLTHSDSEPSEAA